ncbi:MAG: hypothetical protein QOI08_42 [Actinomycetota bacterium]|jgi:anti-sigma factor RsiW|nr:hypothetical protein [Actinomycetota bacterium]
MTQHLSDEAVAAFADGVLAGGARDRAARHTRTCPECAHAVAVQREAVWALRAAPAPALPIGLLDRLRSVPATTPLTAAPDTVDSDGSGMFASFGTMTAAALVPSAPTTLVEARSRRVRPFVLTAAAVVAAAGALVVGSAGQSGAGTPQSPGSPGPALRAGFPQHGPAIAPADFLRPRTR